jgi:hypothetical protein
MVISGKIGIKTYYVHSYERLLNFSGAGDFGAESVQKVGKKCWCWQKRYGI